MTITVDTKKLIVERKKRAWTQEHLAEVSDLGIRTIQRIEKSGSASPESVRALASCFDLSAPDLVVDSLSNQSQPNGLFRFGYAPVALALALLVLIFFYANRPAVANDIKLSFNAVVTAQDDQYEHVGEMTIENGEESQFQMDGVFKVLVSPSDLGNNQVLIALKIFTMTDGDYALVSEPSLITSDGNEAVFSLGLNDENGSQIRVAVTPEM